MEVIIPRKEINKAEPISTKLNLDFKSIPDSKKHELNKLIAQLLK